MTPDLYVALGLLMLFWLLRDDAIEPDEDVADSRKFYQSNAWKRLRRRVLKENKQFYGRSSPTCERSGAHRDQQWRRALIALKLMSPNKLRFHVDHIKPRSKYPELALEYDNCQVLSAHYNLKKSALWGVNWKRLRRARLSLLCPPISLFVAVVR